MATALTADAMLAALSKWGITPKFYKSDWATHNRNAAQGWGPLYGFVVHNFGSDVSDTNSLNYLYTGDTSRGMPGPLSQFAITDDGQVWVIGWGTANHTGSIDSRLLTMVQSDTAPLDSDFKPATSFSNNTGTHYINKNFVGVEMTYGKAPTDAQRKSVALLGAALMDALGTGYTGGSVVGHRETDTGRSDPVGIPMWQLRRDINALLQAGPAGASRTTEPTAPAAPVQEDIMASLEDLKKVIADANLLTKADGGTLRADNAWQNNMIQAQFTALTAAVQALASAKGIDASAIAGVVDKAVRDRLAAVKFDVTDNNA